MSAKSADRVYNKIKGKVDVESLESKRASNLSRTSIITALSFLLIAMVAVIYRLLPIGTSASGGVPRVVATIQKGETQSGISGPVVFQSSGADLFNLDWKRSIYYSLIGLCDGRKVWQNYRAFKMGPYVPYDRLTRKLHILEHSIWNEAPNWLVRLKESFPCLEMLHMTIEYKVQFEDEANVTFTRYFAARVQTDGKVSASKISESNKSAWDYADKLHNSQLPQIRFDVSEDTPLVAISFNLGHGN